MKDNLFLDSKNISFATVWQWKMFQEGEKKNQSRKEQRVEKNSRHVSSGWAG